MIDKPFSLIFEYSSKSLLDSDFCSNTSTMLASAGVQWEISKVTPGLSRFLPSKPGVYMFIWRHSLTLVDGNNRSRDFTHVLYVGKTGGDSSNTIRKRYVEYNRAIKSKTDQPSESNRTERLRKYLNIPGLEFWYATPNDITLIPEIEARLLNLLTPPLNSQRPKLKPRRRISAF